MVESTPFIIYNASAGSGKTFTLVKHYLKILIASQSNQAFRSILALTFTNKAVAEMKTRIIDTLQDFSADKNEQETSVMFLQIAAELNLDFETLKIKSRRILNAILHNYGAFDVSTIDRFNHRLIRTFAHDLKLPLNFEVELDTQHQLSKAVDRLIDKAGTHKELTDLLVDFAVEKADDDRSWDISYDLNAIANLLTTENDLPHIKALEEKSIQEFRQLQKDLKKEVHNSLKIIKDIANKSLQLIESHHLSHKDFSRSSIPNYFIKISQEDLNVNFGLNWQEDLLQGKPPYPARLSADKASIIDGMIETLASAFTATKNNILKIRFYTNILRNIVPLSVLNEIGKVLNELKAEEDFILISEFNAIINREIKSQPAPFIYERIGEKYRHFFIDEFQDTSTLQWENLIPLVDNAIASQNLKGEIGSAMIVGDAKQSIYRWRGGKAEQFIELYLNQKRPLAHIQQVYNLPRNFRSARAIVHFNNTFFRHLSNSSSFTNEQHRSTYAVESQEFHHDDEGYVEVNFIDSSEDIDRDLHYAQTVHLKIMAAMEHGFNKSDICIIVRKSKEGVALANYLVEQGISIISSETLLLKNSVEVIFINNVMKLILEPSNMEVKLDVLDFIATSLLQLEDTHAFFKAHLTLDPITLFKGLNSEDIKFDYSALLSQPIYEAVETIIRSFGLDKESNAYIQFFLDEILSFSAKNHSSFIGFQQYWDRKKDKLSIISPGGKDAVQIMTIHKSKGLEFPVVIFPYANQDIYFDKAARTWFPNEVNLNTTLNEFYLNLNKDLAEYNELGKTMYDDHQSELELDSINLLYVALTRASEQLFIISEYDFTKAKAENIKHYSGLLINYLKSIGIWTNTTALYSFGAPKKSSQGKAREDSIMPIEFISTSKESHNLNIVTNNALLWDTHQEEAIERGNLIHDIMSRIVSRNDIEGALQYFINQGVINSQQLEILENLILKIIDHPQLKDYYKNESKILNEQAIITTLGEIVRPDRIVYETDNQLVLIDYKTGLENSKHKEQLFNYQETLETMGFRVVKKILIYINSPIKVKEF